MKMRIKDETYDFYCTDCGEVTKQIYKGLYTDNTHLYVCMECGCENSGEAQKAFLIERNYKGEYERYALTPEEFRKVFPESWKEFSEKPELKEAGYNARPMVSYWFMPCRINDEQWNRFFSDMSWGLSESDVEGGNVAYIRAGLAMSLRPYIEK